MSAPLDARNAVEIVGHLRTRPDSSDLSQYYLRTRLIHQLGGGWAVQGSYDFRKTLNDGKADVIEHRFTETVVRDIGRVGPGTVDARVSMEQRMIERGDEPGWRWREKVRYSMPVAKGLDAQLTEELIGAFNSTEWGQSSGLNSIRFTAGLRKAMTKAIRVAPAYMFQRNVLNERPDTVDHVLLINVELRL